MFADILNIFSNSYIGLNWDIQDIGMHPVDRAARMMFDLHSLIFQEAWSLVYSIIFCDSKENDGSYFVNAGMNQVGNIYWSSRNFRSIINYQLDEVGIIINIIIL